MPCLVRRIALQAVSDATVSATGLEIPADIPARDLADAEQYLSPDGVYAVFVTGNGRRVVCLSRHLDRLEDSARRLGFELDLDRGRLKAELLRLVEDAGYDEVKFRISVAPGKPCLTLAAEPYPGPPLGLRTHGVTCTLTKDLSRDLPEAKQSRWIVARSAARAANIHETLMVDESGAILEGTSSNFYVLMPPGTDGPPILRTASRGILSGISRSIVLDVAPELVEVELEAPRVADLAVAEEAFITSSSRGIVPVVRVDDQAIGSGLPGPLTASLTSRYEARAVELEEPL